MCNSIIYCFISHYRRVAKERKYSAWEPPSADARKDGKKIVVPKKDPLGQTIEELD